MTRKSQNLTGAFGTVDVAASDRADVTETPDGGFVLRVGDVQVTYSPPDEDMTVGIGDELSDLWLVGPVSPETGQVMALEPFIERPKRPGSATEAEGHIQALKERGHATVRIPSPRELDAIHRSVFAKREINRTARLKQRPGYLSSAKDPQDEKQILTCAFLISATQRRYSDKGLILAVRDEPNLRSLKNGRYAFKS